MPRTIFEWSLLLALCFLMLAPHLRAEPIQYNLSADTAATKWKKIRGCCSSRVWKRCMECVGLRCGAWRLARSDRLRSGQVGVGLCSQ